MELGKQLLKSLNDTEAEIGGEGSLPSHWISTGNYCMNKIISGHIDKGIAVGRVTAFAGPSGVGKSLLMANIIREASKDGYFTIIFDSESAIDKNFLENLGVDTKRTAYITVDTIETFRNKTVDILKSITDEKVLIVLDSLGNLASEKELNDAIAGKNASDMGLRSKLTRATFRIITNMISKKNAAMILSNHTYTDASGYVPVETMAGGKGLEYCASTIIFLTKKMMKDGTEIEGLHITAQTKKNRFAPPFKKVTIDLSFKTGLSKFSGLLDVLCDSGTIDDSSKGWYKFGEDDDQIKFRRKDFDQFAEEHWEELMNFDVPSEFSKVE